MSFKKTASVSQTGATGNSIHSYSVEEKEAFCDHINERLAGNPLVQDLLPVDPTTEDLFRKVQDGRLLCVLINNAVPGTIDERVINKNCKNVHQQTENQNLCINSAKGIGCVVVNIGPQDLIQGKEHLVLGLVWQIVRIGLMSQITLAHHPELFRLLEPGEDINDLLKLPPEQILLRWVNYHLKKAGSSKRINNFSGDIKDSEAYTILLNQLAPNQCDKAALNESDLTKRAEMVLNNADKLGCRKFVKPRDIVQGNPKLNLAFVANLFNTIPGLEPLSEEEKAKLDEALFASEGSREARAFALWLNSLGIDPFVHNLFEDCHDGLVILRAMDKIDPGCVDWKRVNQNLPLNKFKAVENCNYAVALGKDHFKFSLVGIGGTDIYDKNQKLILAEIWQLMRYHVLSILTKLSGDGKPVTEDQLISWANATIAQSGKSSKISNLQDPSLSTGIYFLELIDAVKKCVDWSLVTPGQTKEDAMLNAKYAISVCRKYGGVIFLLPDDIYEVKPKMILTFLASIKAISLSS